MMNGVIMVVVAVLLEVLRVVEKCMGGGRLVGGKVRKMTDRKKGRHDINEMQKDRDQRTEK